MTKHPLRRAHLIAPFGVGSLPVFPDGVSLVVGGLDHWFEPGIGNDWEEFRVEEWRLQERLGVNHFRLPPDHRAPWRFGSGEVPNLDLSVPGLRFPLAHSCSRCSRLDLREATERGRLLCRFCQGEGKRSLTYQVQFVAMCEAGHLQDFPWREWVHRSLEPSCDLSLKIFAAGGSSLVGVFVKCECGKKRNLRGITDATPDGTSTNLTRQLADGADYVCHGLRPWLGEFLGASERCGRPVRGALRSAANAYFADTRSAVYIPRRVQGVDPSLLEILQRPPAAAMLATAKDLGATVTPARLRAKFPGLLDRFPDDAAVSRALEVLEKGLAERPEERRPVSEAQFRAFEFSELGKTRSDAQLLVRESPGSKYEPWVAQHFDRLFLIDKLRETRVFVGFSRIVPKDVEPKELFDQLWRRPPAMKDSWLPASVVFGEGILLTLKADKLRAWEDRAEVRARVDVLQRSNAAAVAKNRAKHRDLLPRFVLIHTLAHVIISRMAFDSGYGAASLAERLYVASPEDGGMAGVLIYTASGDSDGTMGGLVRLGKPGLLEPTIRRALQKAEWCSSDPICMELGDSGGQGPNSCNLAACHNCSLVPETACEEFNRYLDRAMLVGTPEDRSVGFFSGYGE